jgi:hypothetical protein
MFRDGESDLPRKRAAARAEIALAVAGHHLALRILHQASDGRAMVEAQSVTDLVNRDLG